MPSEPYKRYKYTVSKTWASAVEDTYTGEEICFCDEEADAEIIVECLNAIEYAR